MTHHWIKSTLGHGVMMCKNCSITVMEAAALGRANNCEAKMNEPKLTLEEAKAAAAAGKFPKVTELAIKDKIAHVNYLTHHLSTGGVLTICVIEMSNGFAVHGVSAAADPRNHKAEIGERYAFENAFKLLWQLEGYLLRENLYRASHDPQSAHYGESKLA